MTKAEIVQEISAQTGIEKADTAQVLEAFFKAVKNSLAKGENVYVRGFGSFIIKKRAAKIARNISTNTAIHLPEHVKPYFKPSNEFIGMVIEANAKSLQGSYFPLHDDLGG